MIASKFYDEEYLSNGEWAQLSGLDLQEINKLEKRFLVYIGFDINTKIECFINYLQLILSYAVNFHIIEHSVGKQILKYLYNSAVNEAKDGF